MQETAEAAKDDLGRRQKELIQAVARGDERALGELYDLFVRPIYSMGARWLNDPKLAEELVQEVFIRIWRGAQTFDPTRGQASSWVFGIARNAATDLTRSQRRHPVPVRDVHAEEKDGLDEDAAWLSWQVGQALTSLPDDQQRVVELGFMEQHTHSEIAARLGIPMGTVKTRMYMGLRKLKARLLELGVVEESR